MDLKTHFILGSMVSEEKYSVIQMILSIGNALFLSGCFQVIFFIFSFQKYNYDVL